MKHRDGARNHGKLSTSDGCPTSPWLAASLFTRHAGGDSGAAVWRLQLAVAFCMDLLLTAPSTSFGVM